jgi:chromosome segregation ATPase
MAEDSTPGSLVELIEQANRLQGMRARIVREVNELFATIAEVAENERDGKYNALIELAARMQDQRDEAQQRIQELESELRQARQAQAEANARAADFERRDAEKSSALVNALSIRNAAVQMRNELDRERMKARGDVKGAAFAARCHELVVAFDEQTAGMIRAREEDV